MFLSLCEILKACTPVNPTWHPGFAVAHAAMPEYWRLRGDPGALDHPDHPVDRFREQFDADFMAAVAAASGPAHLFVHSYKNADVYTEVSVGAAETRWIRGYSWFEPEWGHREPVTDIRSAVLSSSIGEVVVRRLVAEGLFDWPSPHGTWVDLYDREYGLVCKWGDRCRYVNVWPDALGEHGKRIRRILRPWLRRPGPRLKLASWWHGLRHDRGKRPGQTGSTDAAGRRTW